MKKRNKNLKIKYESPVYCKIIGDWNLIKPCLSYEYTFWLHTQFGRKRKKATKSFVDSDRKFFSGLLDRVKQYCLSQKISLTIEGEDEWKVKPTRTEPYLKGITFRPDQLDLIRRVRDHQRGVIIAPTGSGKTILAFGVMSLFENCRILVLCHNTDIINQFIEDAKKFELSYSEFTGSKKDLSNRIVFATRQSLINLPPEKYAAEFEVVIIDEAHHVQSLESEYAVILSYLMSPVRIGFTATMHKEKSKILATEGLLGPVIGELTLQQAQQLGIVAPVKVTLIPVPFNKKIAEQCTNFKQMYSKGLIQNVTRNKLLVKLAAERMRKFKNVLIMIDRLEHARRLVDLFNKFYPDVAHYVHIVQGSTPRDMRNSFKRALDNKDVRCIISSDVWREGVNIKSLEVVINAYGGKSHIDTMQALGRGIRAFDNKILELVDFLDPYKWLAEHAILRVQLYIKQGWILKGPRRSKLHE